MPSLLLQRRTEAQTRAGRSVWLLHATYCKTWKKLLLLIVGSLELAASTSVVHIIMKYIVCLFGVLDKLFICASYLCAVLANTAVMYCCYVSRFTGVTTTGCLRLHFFFQNGCSIPVH
jgi:hypothetical protein